MSDHERFREARSTFTCSSKREKEWLKIIEEVTIRYPEKAKIFETAWKVGNTEGRTFSRALQETDLNEKSEM